MRLQIMRGQDRLEVDLKLTSKQVEELDVEQAIVPLSHENRHTGVALGTLTGTAGRYFFEEEKGGVMLMGIVPGSPFFYSKFRQGDIITEVDGQAISDASIVLEKLIASGESKQTLTLKAEREGRVISDRIRPVSNLQRSVSFNVPLVVGWKKSASHTNFEIVGGLVFDYQRSALVRRSSGEHYTLRGWSFPLNLIEYKRNGRSRQFKLLWFFGFNW